MDCAVRRCSMADEKSELAQGDKVEAADPQRRNLAIALFGILGGTAFLESCAAADAGDPEHLGELAQALSGNGALQVVDHGTHLRALAGGTTLWIAMMQGYNV